VDLTKLNDDQLVELHHQAKAALKDQDDALKMSGPYVTAQAVLDRVSEILTQRLQDSGASSIATPHGTIHTVSKTTARIMDPEVFREYVIDGGFWDMLDWKANMTACRAMMRSTKARVPGVELSTFSRLSITAPRTPKGDDNGE
jgi:hypothetical protein